MMGACFLKFLVLGLMAGLWHCARHCGGGRGGILSRAGCKKWKPPDIPGNQLPLSDNLGTIKPLRRQAEFAKCSWKCIYRNSTAMKSATLTEHKFITNSACYFESYMNYGS